MNILNNPFTRLAVGLILAVVFFAVFVLLIPSIAFPEGFGTAIKWLVNTLYQWDFILPVNIIFYCLGVFLIFEITAMSIKVLIFAWRIIRKPT